MNETTPDPISSVATTKAPGTKSKRRWFIWIAFTLLILCFVASSYSVWQVHKLGERADDLSFQQTVAEYGDDYDLLAPDVGSIQFMHKGYSITFNTVQYTSSGLELTGTLGNPTQMTLTSINLRLTARDYLYKNREKVLKDPFFMWNNDNDIGSGQTTIPYLGSGRTATFSITIPNVKQTKDGFQIVAQFSGERYSY